MSKVEKHTNTTPINDMEISKKFNGFYHCLLTEAFEKAHCISFREWKDCNSRGCLTFYKGEEPHGQYDCVSCPKGTPFEQDTSLKTIFKMMNTDYGIDVPNQMKISTTEISNRALARHIDWITKIMNENGIQFDHDVEEWDRLKQQAGIY